MRADCYGAREDTKNQAEKPEWKQFTGSWLGGAPMFSRFPVAAARGTWSDTVEIRWCRWSNHHVL